MIGVAAYRAVAPWLIGPLWFRRFTTAVASGAAAGAWGSTRPWVWMLPLGLILMFPTTIGVLLLLVPVVAVWVPLHDVGLVRLGERPAVRHLVQTGWLAVALLGLVALIGDVRAISA
jgi:uncharacterized membrane protein YhaH (DUF805 family)